MLYEEFRVYDFVNDPYFRKWVLDPDTETIDLWKSWQQTHPDSRSTLEQARKLVWLTHFEDIEIKGAAQTKEKIKLVILNGEDFLLLFKVDQLEKECELPTVIVRKISKAISQLTARQKRSNYAQIL